MDSTIVTILFTECYIDDIFIGSKGSLEEYKDIVNQVLFFLDSRNCAIEWFKRQFFKEKIEWLGHNITNSGIFL